LFASKLISIYGLLILRVRQTKTGEGETEVEIDCLLASSFLLWEVMSGEVGVIDLGKKKRKKKPTVIFDNTTTTAVLDLFQNLQNSQNCEKNNELFIASRLP
jgi:hypothetical protein